MGTSASPTGSAEEPSGCGQSTRVAQSWHSPTQHCAMGHPQPSPGALRAVGWDEGLQSRYEIKQLCGIYGFNYQRNPSDVSWLPWLSTQQHGAPSLSSSTHTAKASPRSAPDKRQRSKSRLQPHVPLTAGCWCRLGGIGIPTAAPAWRRCSFLWG